MTGPSAIKSPTPAGPASIAEGRRIHFIPAPSNVGRTSPTSRRHDHHVELTTVSTARALQFSQCSTGGMQRGLFVDCGGAGDANHFIL